jgi:RNA polymerase sigma-70 factor (ECF subfamily)
MPAWEAIVRQHGPEVFRAAWRVLRDVHEAEDVTQEVLLEFFRSGRSHEQPCGGLLQRMAVLRGVDRLRRRHPVVAIDGLNLAARADGPEAQAISNELVDRLHQAVAQLPPRQAEVFCLRYLHDDSYEDIARTLGISRDAVAVALHQARARLRTALAAALEEPCQ